MIKGSVIVPLSSNKMLLERPLSFVSFEGRREPETLLLGKKTLDTDFFETSISGSAFERTGLRGEWTQTNEEDVEVNWSFEHDS